jgi:hypothetical protein
MGARGTRLPWTFLRRTLPRLDGNDFIMVGRGFIGGMLKDTPGQLHGLTNLYGS